MVDLYKKPQDLIKGTTTSDRTTAKDSWYDTDLTKVMKSEPIFPRRTKDDKKEGEEDGSEGKEA